MSVTVTVTKRHRNKDYHNSTTNSKYSYSGSGGSSSTSTTHVEKDSLSGLTSYDVTIDFNISFSTSPLISLLHVYRWSDLLGDGKYTMNDVVWWTSSSPWETDSSGNYTGFSFTISSDEDLDSVIIDYKFEANS